MWGEFTDANLVTYRAQKYYDECGRPVAKYLSREFMEEESPYTSMYMAWSDETPNCVNECGEGKVKVTFNCGIGVGTPTFTTCISKNENIIMPENEWCSYGGERDAFEGWQQYAYPRYTHKQKPYNSSEGVQYAWYSTLLNPGASFTYNNNEYTSELAFTAVYKCTDIYHAVYDHDRCSGGFTEDYGTCVAKDCACENGFIAFEYGSRADLDPYHVEHVCIRDDR